MALNPVERRLLDLCSHWDAFRADTAKRLLVWQVPDNAVRLLQCFFEVQKHETDYTTGDLFVVFDTPFENSIQYSRVLKEALAGQYDASREDLKQQGITPDWQFTPEQYPDSAAGFVQTLCSFGSQHHETIGHLVAVLMPSSIANDDAFASWLLRTLPAGVPERLRLAVTDSIETPRLSQLVGSGNALIYVDTPKIDALTTAQETFSQEGAVGPAAVFRNFLMGLMTLVEKGSAEQVKVKAADALAFARKQQWPDQEVVVTMLVAGALLKEKQFDDAIKAYQGARQAAMLATDSGHPAGQELVLQSWFGEAGAHLADGNDAQAAECYDQAAVVAQPIPNLILAIEAFRMGAFCHARLKNREAAIDRGSIALTLGEQLKPDARAMTTLPIAAIDLLRIEEPERVKLMEDIKHRQDSNIDQSREAAEQRAAEVEQVNDPQQLQDIEQNHATETAQAEQVAAEELDAVAAAGGEQFRQIFTRARKLLGAQWPLASFIDMPRTPAATGVAAA